MGAAAHGTGLEGVTRGREELPPALERGSPRCGPSTPPAPMVPDVRYPHAHNHQVSLGATLTHLLQDVPPEVQSRDLPFPWHVSKNFSANFD